MTMVARKCFAAACGSSRRTPQVRRREEDPVAQLEVFHVCAEFSHGAGALRSEISWEFLNVARVVNVGKSVEEAAAAP